MTMITSRSSADFFAAWKHSLSADFQHDGVPAKSDPWLTQDSKIAMSDNALVLALNDDNALLAAAVGHDIHVYDMATSQLLHTLPGDAGSSQKSGKMTYMCRVWNLDAPVASDRLDDAVKAAAIAASSTLSQYWPLSDLEAADLQTKFAEIAAGSMRNGASSWGLYLGTDRVRSATTAVRFSMSRTTPTSWVLDLDVATLRERLRLSGHTNSIMWAETSPDDMVVATSSWDKTTRIWSMESGELIHVLEGATMQSWAGAFSPDGALIASGSGDNIVRIWRVDTGELVAHAKRLHPVDPQPGVFPRRRPPRSWGGGRHLACV
ncbi:WD40-repeat-containing domain protein [Mycena olivaceomarginata]|nr:WD40-repeat-containing domain protein [Mycena olivaceomarginata]